MNNKHDLDNWETFSPTNYPAIPLDADVKYGARLLAEKAKPEQNDQTCKDVQRFSNTAVNPQFQQPQPEIDASSSVTLPEPELFFQAVGLVRGQYLPSAGTPGQGILLLNDGLMTPTNLLASAAYTVDKHSELLESPQVWIVYPRPMQESPRLHFAIRGVRNPLHGEDAEVIEQSVDSFTIRGIVSYHNADSGEFAVRVYRNFRPWHELDGTKYKPYSFTIAGILPSSSSAYGQFWNLKVKRVSDQFVLEDAAFVAQVLPPKEPKKKRSKHQSRKR